MPTFEELLNRHNFSHRAREILYLMSNRVKNITDYVQARGQPIDFCHLEFEKNLSGGHVGKCHFHGHEFRLLPGVFVPRHETELLVDECIRGVREIGDKNLRYIDICAGSGVVGICVLLAYPNMTGTLLDISPEAAENIKLNLGRFSVNAEVIVDDWLKHLQGNNADVITANFPYVGENDEVDPELRDPCLALYAEHDGWFHYQQILNFMANNGSWKLIVLECSAYHSDRWINLSKILTQYEWHISHDINGILRVVRISRKGTCQTPPLNS